MGEATSDTTRMATAGPVSLGSKDCGNGKRKVVVREREYDALSWQGLKTIGALFAAVGAVIVAVLGTYYTAEGAQNAEIATHKQRLADNDRRLTEAFERLNATIVEQKTSLDRHREAVEAQTKIYVEMTTRQSEVIIPTLDRLDRELNKLNDKVDRLHPNQ